MISTKKIIILCLFGFLVGVIFFAFDRQWLIIRSPFHDQEMVSTGADAERKQVSLYYWHHDKWTREQTEMVWSSDKAQTLKHLIDHWLTFMHEEEIMEKRVALESAILSPGEQELYISFDRNLFSKESSTFEKWMLIEGILKTIRENGLKVGQVRFLMHHQPMQDYHLDFSKSWPINGFMNE